MKKLILLFLFIFDLTYVKGQITFQKNYGTTHRDFARKILQLPNGEYLVTGETAGFGAADNIFLMKMGATGNVLWIKNLFGVNDDFSYDLVLEQNNGYSIAGATASFGTGNRDGILITVDSLGNVKHSATFGTAPNDDYLQCIKKINGGYILAGGATWSPSPGTEILKTDSSGNIIWSYKMPGPSISEIVNSVFQTHDNGFIALSSPDPSSGGGYFILMKLDQNGTLLWSKQYSSTNGNYQLIATKMVHTQDNGYIITGYSGQNAVGAADDILLLKTDSLGNMLWTKLYGDISVERGNDVIQTSDGGYAVTGSTTSFGFGATDAILLKTDQSGNFKWAKTFGDVWNDETRSLIQTTDGGFIMTGSTTLGGYASDSTRIFVVKVDSLGNSSCNDTAWYPISQGVIFSKTNAGLIGSTYGTTTFPTVVSNLKSFTERNFCNQTNIDELNSDINCSLYPNPFSNSTTLHFSSNTENLIFEINNCLGETIRKIKPESNAISIERNGLPSGIYFLRVRQQDKVLAVKKLVIAD